MGGPHPSGMTLTDPTPSPPSRPERIVLGQDESILIVPGFLSPEECEAFIRLTEARGYRDAPVTTFRGFVMRPDIRNNTRVMIDDEALAARLWARMEPFVPAVCEGWRACGLNERFRYYRYQPGQYFKSHSDGAYFRSVREESLYTAMVYLNEGFGGGSTDFQDGPFITPRQGLLLLFKHPLRHQGSAVTHGCKYVLRTDVKYRQPPQPSSENS